MDDKIPYVDDDAHSLFIELQNIEKEIRASAEEVKTSGRQAAWSKADYDQKKHQALLEMFTEEAAPEWVNGKRTIDQRAAKYRTDLQVERMAMALDERNFDIARDYLKSLLAIAMSTQSRAKLLSPDKGFA